MGKIDDIRNKTDFVIAPYQARYLSKYKGCSAGYMSEKIGVPLKLVKDWLKGRCLKLKYWRSTESYMSMPKSRREAVDKAVLMSYFRPRRR